MSERILITSALPYANGPLHFGHLAGAYLPGDIYARFQRLQGRDVLYVCGSDEYGIAITLSAELAGRTPKQQVDHFHQINHDLFKRLHFSFDHYSRTTWPGHEESVVQFFNDLLANGYIFEKEENHLYSEKEGRFLSDRYVVGTCPKCSFEEARGDECTRCGASYEAIDLKNPRSKLTGTPLVLKPSLHWYLAFDAFKDKLKEWILQKNWKENVVAFAMHYINDLRPRAITRDTPWGIKVPLEKAKDKVFYVWFDAPIGYISATKEWAIKRGDPFLWKRYWLDPSTKLVHFIGKDNIPFHAVFFPAMIMGQNQPYKLPDEVPANEFLLLEGKQFSKSEGWYVDLADFLDRYPADLIRYTLAANAPEAGDSDFSWKDFQMRCNVELLGKFGNLVHRTLVFAKNHCDSRVPPIGSDVVAEEFLGFARRISNEIALSFNTFKVRKAIQLFMELCQRANAFFDERKPWIMAKHPEQMQELNTTIGALLDVIKLLSLLISPVMPTTAEKIWQLLGYTTSLEKESWDRVVSTSIPPGQVLKESYPLFAKIEDSLIQEEIEKLGKKTGVVSAPLYALLKADIPFEHFETIDLRVAKVVACSKVPKSKRLLKLEVDLGFEKRTIVSGIAEHYLPEDLLDKKILIVANIPPVKIMGIESRGMVLASSLGDRMELPQFSQMDLGASVN